MWDHARFCYDRLCNTTWSNVGLGVVISGCMRFDTGLCDQFVVSMLHAIVCRIWIILNCSR